MKEEQLEKEYPKLKLEQEIYYTLDDEGNVAIDIRTMREEFEAQLNILDKENDKLEYMGELN